MKKLLWLVPIFALAATVTLSLRHIDWQDFGDAPTNPPLTNVGQALAVSIPEITTTALANCIPTDSCPSLNYLYTPNGNGWRKGKENFSRASYLSLTLNMQTTGPVVFNYAIDSDNVCVYPAHVRPFIWQWNGEEQGYDRWWAQDPYSYELGPGAATITVPLQPQYWSSVYGELGNSSAAAEAGFEQALKYPEYVGVTFGGGCFFGHGVTLTGGTAQFQITSYSIH